MSTPNMVERVGEALRSACRKEFGSDWCNDVAWDFARAAIDAMREPTNAMQWAGYVGGHPEPERAWHAMIDAALAEPNQP